MTSIMVTAVRRGPVAGGLLIGLLALVALNVGAAAQPNDELTIGLPVAYEALDGSESLVLTIDEVLDPFETANPVLLGDGQRYVGLRLTVTNPSMAQFDLFNKQSIQLLGDDGVLYRDRTLIRDAESNEADPAFPFAPIAASATVSGLFFFELPESTGITAIQYAPAFDRQILLAGSGSGPAPSDQRGVATVPSTGDPAPVALAQPDLEDLQADGAYASKLFGHVVSWDPAVWVAAAAFNEAAHDQLILEGEVMDIRIDALGGFDGGPQGCVQTHLDEDIEAALGFDVVASEIAPPTSDRMLAPAAGIYLIRATGDDFASDRIRYVECRTLSENEAVLRIVVTGPERFWPIDRELATAVLEGISMPVWSPATRTAPVWPQRAVGDGPAEVEPVFCNSLLSVAISADALASRQRQREGRDSMVNGSNRGEACWRTIDSETNVIVGLEPGDPLDFDADTRFVDAVGETLPGVGHEARLFRAADGGKSAGLSVLAVFERRDVGDLYVRFTLGRPDLDSPARTLALVDVARAVLSRMPGSVLSPEPEPRPDRARLSFVENVLERADDGDWSVGEGLVRTLRLFADEGQAGETLPAGSVFVDEGTSILTMAQEYVRAGEGELAVITELEHLLDDLVYSGTELELMAGIRSEAVATVGPVAQAGGGSQVELCTRFFKGMIVPGVGPCLEWASIDIPGVDAGKYRIFVPTPDLPQAGWTAEHLELVRTGLRTAAVWFETEGVRLANQVGGSGLMPRVNVVLSVSPGSPASASAWPWGEDGCGVVLYRKNQSKPDSRFLQTIAHELAHCFSIENFPALAAPAYEDFVWREEGMASFLANVIWPDADHEYEFWFTHTLKFDVDHTILDLAYGNFIYFQFLENEIGLGGIFRLISTLPMTADTDRSHQAASLAAFGDMRETMLRYGQALIDGTIKDSSDALFPHLLPYESVVIATPTFETHDVLPFGLGRSEWRVSECKIATLEADVGNAREAYRPADADEWGELPATLPREPGGARRLINVVVAVEPQVVIHSVGGLEPDPECEEDPPPVACPFDCPLSAFFR